MKSGKFISSITLVFAICSSAASSLETGLPVSINGFGTLAAVHNDNSDLSFYGAHDQTDWDADSVLGLQLKLPLSDTVAVTGQFITRGQENYDLKTDWLFLSYSAMDDLDGRIGRLRIPFFMFSESLEVGYSYPWIRPPVDVYGQLGFNSFDGGDLVYRMPVGSMSLELQPYFGEGTHDIIRPGQNGQLEVSNLWGLHAVLGNDWFSLHAGHTEGDFDIKNLDAVNGFLLGLESFGYPNVANQFSVANRHGTFDGIGIDASWEQWRFISEYTKRGTDGLIANSHGWYATLAYSIGAFTPHLTFSSLETDEDYGGEQLSAASMPPPLAMGAGMFVRENKINQSSVTLGLRWDIMKNAALKMEWQRTNPDNDSSPLFRVMNPAYPGDPANIYSMAVDFVF